MDISTELPILGFAAHSGSGKTTLLLKILPLLRQRGLRVGVIKHAHHNFDIDVPGKDSYELRKAGASQMLVASAVRRALIVENEVMHEPSVGEMLGHLDQPALDLILIEGFKLAHIPKIEVHRPSLGLPPLFLNDERYIAVASDEPSRYDTELPVLDLNRPQQIAAFILNRMVESKRAYV